MEISEIKRSKHTKGVSIIISKEFYESMTAKSLWNYSKESDWYWLRSTPDLEIHYIKKFDLQVTNSHNVGWYDLFKGGYKVGMFRYFDNWDII